MGLEVSVGKCNFFNKFEFLNTFESLDFPTTPISTTMNAQVLSTNAIKYNREELLVIVECKTTMIWIVNADVFSIQNTNAVWELCVSIKIICDLEPII